MKLNKVKAMRMVWRLTTAAVVAFAGGLALGLLMAPRPGRELRQELASKARARLQGLEQQLRQLESHLRQVEARFRALLPEDTETALQLKDQDVAQELPRMPHR